MKLGVAFGWHTLPIEALLELVQLAEDLGYDAAYVDGDVSQLGSRPDADVLDGWSVTLWLLARTRRIGVGSIRLVQHWNPAKLAQAAATAERLAPGRLQFFASIGERPEDPRWGYERLAPSERIAWLDETLDAVRALWRGEAVDRSGRRVQLEGARVRPTPSAGALPIEVGARRARLLRVVARHAEIWNVNWPPIPGRVEASAAQLEEACETLGRDPATIRRRLWMYTRVGAQSWSDALAGFRRWNPWHAELRDAELEPALVVGSAAECRDRIVSHSQRLGLEMPVLDLSGLDVSEARITLESLPAGDFD